MCLSYVDIINFCASLTIPQLIAYKDYSKQFKAKEYFVACEVLNIRLNKKVKKFN